MKEINEDSKGVTLLQNCLTLINSKAFYAILHTTLDILIFPLRQELFVRHCLTEVNWIS
jgi:hypothetical protein